MSLGQFLGVTGRDEQEFLDELRAGALQSVKADLALRALVEAEAIEVTDEELDEELAAMGERLEMDADAGAEPAGTGRAPGGGTLGPTQGQGDAVAGR